MLNCIKLHTVKQNAYFITLTV